MQIYVGSAVLTGEGHLLQDSPAGGSYLETELQKKRVPGSGSESAHFLNSCTVYALLRYRNRTNNLLY
jgi:hypothetical protein